MRDKEAARAFTIGPVVSAVHLRLGSYGDPLEICHKMLIMFFWFHSFGHLEPENGQGFEYCLVNDGITVVVEKSHT